MTGTAIAAPKPDGWNEALSIFGAAELAGGLAPDTVRVKCARLLKLTNDLDRGPWDLSAGDVQSIIDRIDASDISAASKKAGRVAVRSFYRWAHAVGHTSDQLAPTPQPTKRVYSADARWRDALSLYEAAMRAERHTEATIVLRTKHIARFACTIDLPPWEITREHLLRWFESLTGGDGTQEAHRASLRAFYRWGHRSGRIEVDPSWAPSRRAIRKLASPEWERELGSWRTYLRAIGRSESTIETAMGCVRRFARENASLPPYAATLDDLIDWLASKRHWSAEFRRSNRSALRSFYGWAADCERIDKSPAAKIPVMRAGHPLPRPVIDQDYEVALSKAADRERLALRLSAELGLRRGEVVMIHSRDLEERAGRWSLTVHGKGNKRRTLPVPDELARRLRDSPGYLFPGNDAGHLAPRTLGKLVSQLLPPGVTMHALRHRFATRAYAVAGDVLAVQQLLGHASPATTVRYVQVSDENLRQLVEAVR